MSDKLDLINQKFGYLTVIKHKDIDKNRTMWECLCVCGNNIIVPGKDLTYKNTTSCGCKRNKTKKMRTLFWDLDGTICIHNYDPINVPDILLENSIETLKICKRRGYFNILTTARTAEEARHALEMLKEKINFEFDKSLYSLPSGKRFLYNDTDNDGHKKAFAFNSIRNNGVDFKKLEYEATKDPIKKRKYMLRAVYNLSSDEYDKLLMKQNNVCAACNEEENTVKCGKLMPLSVDHNHKTGKIRGLLCNNCNRALGLAKDNKQVLINLIKYLEDNNE